MFTKIASLLLAGISIFAFSLSAYADNSGGGSITTSTSRLLSCELSANLNNIGVKKIDFYLTQFTGSESIAYTQQLEFQFADGQVVRYDSLSGFGNLQDLFRTSFDRSQILGFGMNVRGRAMGARAAPTGAGGTTLFLSASAGGRNHDVFDCK